MTSNNNSQPQINIGEISSNQLTKSIENNSTSTGLNVPQSLQDKIIDQVLLQSSGVGLGFILAFTFLFFAAKIMGIGGVIKQGFDYMNNSNESLRSMAEAFKDIVTQIKDNHSTYLEDHKDILEEVEKVQDLLKDNIIPSIRKIESQIDRTK